MWYSTSRILDKVTACGGQRDAKRAMEEAEKLLRPRFKTHTVPFLP